jgi:hypothetical protein
VAFAALLGTMLVPATAVAGRGLDASSGCRTALCASISPDGSRIVFPHDGELIAGVGKQQIYEWDDGQIQSLLPPDLVKDQFLELDGASADATHVFVSTSAPLSPDDTDGSGWDIYDIHDGTPSLISTGPLDGPSEQLEFASFRGASPDGSRVFFTDARALTGEDLDKCASLYERAAGQTRMVAPNPTPPPYPLCESAEFGGVSRDGSHFFFVGNIGPEVNSEEGNGTYHGDDIYQQVGALLTPLTTYPEPDWNCTEFLRFIDSSSDGGTILFSTDAAVLPEDTNRAEDLYKRRPDGSFVLVSKGTPADQHCGPRTGLRGVALSADGGTTIFETSVALSPADQDTADDLYSEDESGAIELLSTGPTDPQIEEPTTVSPDWITAVSDDAKTVAFETRQRLVAADKDDAPDVYVRAGGVTSLLSAGPPNEPPAKPAAELSGISADGSTVVFATREGLVAGDTNHERDFYMRKIGSKHPVLLSAETIPPRMSIARRAARLRSRSPRVAIRLTCPKVEQDGPCHGRLSLAKTRHGRPLGRSSFSIAVGKRKRIVVRLHRTVSPARRRLVARALGVDHLGNAHLSIRKVRLGS